MLSFLFLLENCLFCLCLLLLLETKSWKGCWNIYLSDKFAFKINMFYGKSQNNLHLYITTEMPYHEAYIAHVIKNCGWISSLQCILSVFLHEIIFLVWSQVASLYNWKPEKKRLCTYKHTFFYMFSVNIMSSCFYI